MKFWVGTTDADWFRFLSGRRLDEVNFWQPTASPPLRIQVSPGIHDAWFIGKAYYRVDGQPLAVLPDEPAHRPDPELLDWHIRNVYQG